MRRGTAGQQRDVTFAVGNRVSHREHGDGMVTGRYGRTKFSVDFDNCGTKRVPPESLSLAAPMSADELASLLRERDARRAKARAKYGLLPEQPPKRDPQPEAAATVPTPEAFHPDDFQLASFDWKLVPPGSPFWEYWNSDKDGMKAGGFRVTKDGRDWLVCKHAVADAAPAVAEPHHASAQIIQFPRSRIVRLIVGGQPVDEAAGNEAA
jgi:hypothetical protein